MNEKNYHKNMITCIILEKNIHYNMFIMMEMNTSMTRYQVSHFASTDVASSSSSSTMTIS